MTTFPFCQCQSPDCRFRYPVTDGRTGLDACPRCGSETAVTPALPPAHADTAPKHAAPTGPRLSALLDNIRSVYNVGSLFRTADGAGLHHLYLGGITAPPTHPRLAKTALGAESQMGWSHHRNGLETAVMLQQQGQQLWALETAAAAGSLFEVRQLPPQPVTLIVGNEVAGIDPAILARCDRLLALPMHGVKESLNVAVAFGIAVYHLRFGLTAAG